MASKIPGLTLRGGVFWLRVLAPKELQVPFYGGKRIAFEGSLRTSDPQVSRVTAAAKRAEMEAQFLRQRRELSPPTLSTLAPEIRRCIVETLLSQEIATDAEQRQNKAKTTSVHGGVMTAYADEDGTVPPVPPGPPVSLLRPYAAKVVTGRTAANLHRLEAVRKALVSDNLAAMLPIVQPIAKRLGLAIDYETPDGALLLQECLAAYAQAREVATQRDTGLIVPTPPLPPVPPEVTQQAQAPSAPGDSRGAVHLRDIMAEWLKIKPRTREATKVTERSLKLMDEAGINVPLTELDRTHGAKLRAHLIATGIKGQSVKNLMVPLQALLNVAVDIGKLRSNPWTGLKIDTSDSTQRLPWRLEDLQRLVTANNAKTDGGRWLLPLGLYTSARIGELAQIELADIQQIDGVWCIEVHDRKSEGHAKRTVKTKAGQRLIPVHQHLCDLGFLDHVQARRAAGDRFLFPTFIQGGKRRPTELAGIYFLRLREESGVILDERFTFHSLRHNGRSMLAAAGVNEQIIDKLVGHESGTVQGRYAPGASWVYRGRPGPPMPPGCSTA